MANSSFNLPSPLTLIPKEINTPSNQGFVNWLYTVFLRIKTGVKLAVHKNANNQSISDATATKLTWTTVVSDSIGGWDTTNNQYVVQMEGSYIVTAQARLSTTLVAGKLFTLEIYQNGASVARCVNGDVVVNPFVSVTRTLECSPTDTIAIYATQDTGGAVNVLGTIIDTFLNISRIN